MGKYLHYYDTGSAFTAAYNGDEYMEPWVSYTEQKSIRVGDIEDWHSYVGEADVYDYNAPDELLGKYHVWVPEASYYAAFSTTDNVSIGDNVFTGCLSEIDGKHYIFNYGAEGELVTQTKNGEHVDYNKRQLVLEFDTQVTETVMYSSLDDSWSSSTADSLYPVTGGNVQDFLNALDEGIDIKYIVHNYNGDDAVFYGDMLNGGSPENMDQSAFGLSCRYGLVVGMHKETGTDKLYLLIGCIIG